MFLWYTYSIKKWRGAAGMNNGFVFESIQKMHEKIDRLTVTIEQQTRTINQLTETVAKLSAENAVLGE
jgi:flagellar biosynthesis chaperone FliJ